MQTTITRRQAFTGAAATPAAMLAGAVPALAVDHDAELRQRLRSLLDYLRTAPNAPSAHTATAR